MFCCLKALSHSDACALPESAARLGWLPSGPSPLQCKLGLQAPNKLPCPFRWLAPEYRRPLIVQELLGYNADVICLQEVDESAFRVCLQPHMEAAGALFHRCPLSYCCTVNSEWLMLVFLELWAPNKLCISRQSTIFYDEIGCGTENSILTCSRAQHQPSSN